jgi:hypothetical protein
MQSVWSEDMMHKFRRIALGVAFVGLTSMLACSNKGGVDPKPAPDSRVYVSMSDFPPRVYIFDGETDTLVDSIMLPENWSGPLIATDPTSARIVISRHPLARVYEGPAMKEPVAELDFGIHRFVFTQHPSYLLGSDGFDQCGEPETLIAVNPVTIGTAFVDTIGLLGELVVDNENGLVYGLRYSCNEFGTSIESNLGAYDYVERRFHREWTIRSEVDDDDYFIAAFDLHPDGRRLYAAASTPHGFVLICYDLDEREVLFEIPVFTAAGQPRLEVWYPEPGQSQLEFPEIIRVFSAATGASLAEIPLSDYRTQERYKVSPRYMRFLPSGDKLYVSCGSDLPGPLLVIDTKSRSVVNSFFLDGRFKPMYVRVGPAPRVGETQ